MMPAFLQVGGKINEDDFSLEKHRVIFRRICNLQDRGETIDRITLANELMKHGELQSIDGLSYLVSLDDGLPQIYSLDSYVNIVKEKSLLRRIITVSQGLINRCISGNGRRDTDYRRGGRSANWTGRFAVEHDAVESRADH